MNANQSSPAETVSSERLLGLLGEKHEGMRVSLDGVIKQAAPLLESAQGNGPGYGFMLTELLKHLHQVGERYYAGDVKVVDEFLQLYCLDDSRPNIRLDDAANTKANS